MKRASPWPLWVAWVLSLSLGACNCFGRILPPDPDPTPPPPNDIRERLVKAARVDPFANLRWLCYSSDAKYILMVDVGDIHVVDALTLERKGYRGAKEPRERLSVDSLATFPDQNLCVAGVMDAWPSTMPLLYVLTIPELEIVKKIEIPVKVIDEEKIDRGSLRGFKSISVLRISPDGRYLALVFGAFGGRSRHLPPEQLGVWIYDTQTWELKHILRRGEDGFPGCVYEPAEFLFHPNGKEILVSFAGHQDFKLGEPTEADVKSEAILQQAGIRRRTGWVEAFCFDVETGERKWRLWGPAGAGASHGAFSMTSDGAFLCGKTQGGKEQNSRHLVTFWQWGGTRPVEQFASLDPDAEHFWIAPNGEHAIFYSRDLALWNVKAHRTYFRARMPTRMGTNPTFSPDSKHLVFVQGGDVLYLVNIEPDFKQPAEAPAKPSSPGQDGGK